MLCVLDSVGEDYTYEWVYGSWKAEVNFYSQEVLLAQATGVRGDWPLTHGSYQQILVLYDPGDFFVKLRDAMLALPPERFMETIREVIVGELYEWIGKLRNARYMGHTTYLPELALNMAKYGAFIIGLFNRHTYSTGPRLLEESLALPYRPAGYDALCHLAMRGDLSYPDRMAELCEAFWAGVEQWAIEQGIVIEESSKIPF
jgi:kanamycin nucleotidyltransferase